MYIYISDKKLL